MIDVDALVVRCASVLAFLWQPAVSSLVGVFTGIVKEQGEVLSFDRLQDQARLSVAAPRLGPHLTAGDSVSVDGCCLTVTVKEGKQKLSFDLSAETLACSTLGSLEPGDRVNLEPPLRVGDPLGGHYVQGHVDAVGRVRSLEPEGEGARMWIEVPPQVIRYCVSKGSLTVSGVSLTIAELGDDWVAVALIPYTLAETTLGALKPGDQVNLEADVIAKYVQRLFPGQAER